MSLRVDVLDNRHLGLFTSRGLILHSQLPTLPRSPVASIFQLLLPNFGLLVGKVVIGLDPTFT